jgi:hypothetical protein
MELKGKISSISFRPGRIRIKKKDITIKKTKASKQDHRGSNSSISAVKNCSSKYNHVY